MDIDWLMDWLIQEAAKDRVNAEDDGRLGEEVGAVFTDFTAIFLALVKLGSV